MTGAIRREAAIAWIAVAVLVIASVLPSPGATLWPDTVRDLSQSLSLARGESLPLAGPSINFGPSLGPAWIWIQALPLFFGASMAATSVFVALLASLKFCFLYALGRVLSGSLLGLCLAAAAALPSIAAFQWIVFFHPNLVEAAVAAALFLAALSVRKRSIGIAYAAAAVLGLAIQFHPTAIFYYPLLALAIVRICESKIALVGHLAGTGLAIAAWFLPLLMAPGAGEQQAAGLDIVLMRIGGALRSFRVEDVAIVLRTAYLDVPWAIGDTYAARAGVAPAVWILAAGFAACVCIGGLVASIWKPGGGRWLVLGMAAYLLAGWVSAVAVREYTSFYLCYFLLPLSALLLGSGLARAAGSAHRVARLSGQAAIAASIACLVIASLGARLVGRDAWIESRLPLLADLKHPTSGTAVATLATATARDRLATYVCARNGPVVLYGEFAFALAGSTGFDFRLHCASRAADISILGPPEGRFAITGLSRGEARRLGRKPLETFGGIAAFEVKAAISPPASRSIEAQWYYFEQLRDPQPLARHTRTLRTGPGEAVAILRLKPFGSRWKLIRIERDSQAVTPTVSTFNRDVFVSAPSGSAWTIEFETDAPQWVDIHSF